LRYIFTAAVCTLCLITALLALPPIGQTEALLVSVAAGDREAISAVGGVSIANDGSPESPRQLMSPVDTSSELDGEADAATQESGPSLSDLLNRGSSAPGAENAASSEEEPVGSQVDPASSDTSSSTTTTSTTTTAAPETTTTEAPETTTTTAAPETTTTTEAPAVDPSDGGVVISPNGVVLPIIGPGADGGWRVTTPCANEVTIRDGEQVVTVDFVLDPGHGGSETGAVGPAGATEKELNVRIAEIVEFYLEEAGYSVLLARRTDIRIPLRSRAEIANSLMPDAFVSIHHNGGATRPQSTPGTEMFVDAGNPESRRLGGILFEELTGRLSQFDANWVGTWRNGVSARLNSDGADLYGIHRYTPDVVSVITEAGYLSNPSEEALFVDNDVQWAHGRAIADGLMRWKRTSDPGTGFLDDFTDDSSSGTGGYDGCEDPAL